MVLFVVQASYPIRNCVVLLCGGSVVSHGLAWVGHEVDE